MLDQRRLSSNELVDVLVRHVVLLALFTAIEVGYFVPIQLLGVDAQVGNDTEGLGLLL